MSVKEQNFLLFAGMCVTLAAIVWVCLYLSGAIQYTPMPPAHNAPYSIYSDTDSTAYNINTYAK